MAHAPSGASTRDSVTVNDCVSLAARHSCFGGTGTSNPGGVAAAVDGAAEPDTLRTVRRRVWAPASLPTAIEAAFSSDAEIGARVLEGGLNCTPWPIMHCRYSLGVVG